MYRMNIETFDVFKAYDDTPREDIINSFEIDELIIEPIQALNRKGYLTKFCCSGHPFYDPELYWHDNAYIYFKNPPNFDKLPSKWYVDICDQCAEFPDTIRCDIMYCRSRTEYYRKLMKAIDYLMIWVNTLPNNNNNN